MSKTIYGVTFAVNDDGSITVSGEISSPFGYDLVGSYGNTEKVIHTDGDTPITLSGMPGESNCFIRLYYTNDGENFSVIYTNTSTTVIIPDGVLDNTDNALFQQWICEQRGFPTG